MLTIFKLGSFLFLFSFAGIQIHAQSFGINTTTVKPSAVFEVKSANKGVIVPQVSLTSRADITTISSPDTSLLIYNTSSAGAGTNKVTPGYYYWSGNNWQRLIAGTDSMANSSIHVNPDIDTTSGCLLWTTLFNNNSFTIPDNDVVTGVTSIINYTGMVSAICRIEVGVRINHPFDADLVIYLVDPNGDSIRLSKNNGGSGINYGSGTGPYTYTLFTDLASSSITTGTPPFAGSYLPQSTLTVLNGLTMNGNWKLRIFDDASFDVGTLLSWQLNIYTTVPATNWTLIEETPMNAGDALSLIASASYSSDPLTNGGVKTALTVNTVSAGALGTTIVNLPGNLLFRSAASPSSGAGNYWVSTCMQGLHTGLTPNQTYYYQVWRKGAVEPGNENCSLIVTRQSR